PVNGLDPQARIEMRDLLIELARQGKTLLVTSHILPELARICHLVAIVTNGKLRAFGTVEDIGQQVSQQRTMEVTLMSENQVTPTADYIRKVLGDDSEVIESHAEATVRFRTARTEAELGELLKRLIQGNVRVTQFREVQTDLEEAFMSFARPQEQTEPKRAEAGAPAHA
ncbi:MAG: ABC transporter ATP-binding protein, partial [Planctomycetaceae bacterium]|nr:ABC transporter ATP-binding protein [Planctomycetaceae bacterium]